LANIVEIKNLVKTFGDKVAVDDLKLSIERGSIFGLLGRNGAGKTTTIRMIMDVFRADSGTIHIDGVLSTKNKQRIGYLPEERGLYPKRIIIEQMTYLGQLRGLSESEARNGSLEKLILLGAEEYANKKLDTLSKGNQQKIQLALALIGKPLIIILDEPFSGLDPVNASVLKQVVRDEAKNGTTVIFSSHQMAQVEEFCRDICIIDSGRDVLSGNLAKIKKSYPRDTIYIEPEEGSMAKFKNDFHFPGIKPQGNGFEIKLDSDSHKAEFLASLMAKGIAFDKFEVKEPSLEQIFVGAVGREKEVENV
jgi:ABC-2 type transport system ATP-binding protein